jgi:hypothetical protein
MKILAKSGPRTYLLEAASEEIDFLAGKQICKDSCGQENQPQHVLGTKFNIVDAFVQIHRNNNRKKEVEAVRRTLEGIINGLDLIGPFIEEPKPETPAESEKI